MHILIAEDDVPVAKFLSSGLESEHYEVRIATAGRQVSQMMEAGQCDLVILDLNLPDVSGMEVLRQVGSANPHFPVLILTEPALVRVLLRLSSLPFEPVLRSLDLELDRVRRIVSRGGRSIELTPKEFALLEYLMLNTGLDVSRSSIIHHVWKLSSDTLTNVVDVYINYLRRKIDVDSPERLIHTVRGAGYRLGARSVPARAPVGDD